MSKLIYKTKKPRKGFRHHESFMTHKMIGLRDKVPTQEIQKKAHELVGDTLRNLIIELSEMGYDQTKVGFYIHY
jgi:hypothetical protein